MDSETPRIFTPARLGGLDLKNRVIKSATFEGMAPGGIPSPRLTDFHRTLAEGGVAMTTLAYCATEADGRLSEGYLYLHEGIESELRSLVAEVQSAGARVSGQMVHCGGFSKNRKLKQLKRPLGPSCGLNMLGLSVGRPIAGAMSLSDIDRFVDSHAYAAALMERVGFDAIEIHFGHGYGLSQFISRKTNRRTDDYGGPFENRMRLSVRVLEAVRSVVGDGFPILGKMSMSDGVRGGLDWDEGVQVAKRLDEAGIDGLVTSAGTSSFNPMLMFRGPSVAAGMIENEKNPLIRLGLRMMGPVMFKKYPYEELYLLDAAKRIRDAVRCSVIYIGGCSTLASVERVLAEGFDFVQLGRPLIKDPAFVQHAMADPNYQSGCSHCNRCVGRIDHPDGILCVENEPIREGSP